MVRVDLCWLLFSGARAWSAVRPGLRLRRPSTLRATEETEAEAPQDADAADPAAWKGARDNVNEPALNLPPGIQRVHHSDTRATCAQAPARSFAPGPYPKGK